MAFIPVFNKTKIEDKTDSPKFGIVVDNKDPEGLGRIKVSLPGMMDDTDGTGSNLPWVRKAKGDFLIGEGVECYSVPSIGSVVEVLWPYDNKTPIYRGAPFNQKDRVANFDVDEWGFADDSGFMLKVNRNEGSFVLKTRGGIVTGDSGGNINITGGSITISGSTTIDGKLFLEHQHSNGNQGSNTGGVV